MARICFRCKRPLRPQEEQRTEKVVTHGLCARCTLHLADDLPSEVRDRLNDITEPVLVLDSRGVVRTANASGQKLLGKNLVDIEGHPGGEVFGCAFANLPKGCGRTDYCRTCAIRNLVMDTLAHGRGYTNVPAFQNIETPHGNRIMRFNVSTEKIDHQILLRIDDVTERATA